MEDRGLNDSNTMKIQPDFKGGEVEVPQDYLDRQNLNNITNSIRGSLHSTSRTLWVLV